MELTRFQPNNYKRFSLAPTEPALRIASWNVNSIRARRERVLAWLDEHTPDVLCLQETKVADEHFPVEEFEARGYRAAISGQKSYNGVAIVSRAPLDNVTRGLNDGDSEEGARLIAADLGRLRVYSCYVPNGQVIGSDAAATKLRWLARLRARLESQHKPSDYFAVCGDFNVAFENRDVHDPVFWKTQVLFHPDMQAALREFVGADLVDTFRIHQTGDGLYSWWDYRMLAFPKNRGLRIDYVFASGPLAERCRDAFIDRNARKGKSPSDHAPVVADFDV